jgi:YHS domain-containing protein
MRFLIQILAFLMVIYFVRAILRSLLPSLFSQPAFKKTGNPAPASGRVVKQGKMEKDPVCGTYVDVATSLHETFGGETKYFCSPNCQTQYQQTFYHERNSKSV